MTAVRRPLGGIQTQSAKTRHLRTWELVQAAMMSIKMLGIPHPPCQFAQLGSAGSACSRLGSPAMRHHQLAEILRRGNIELPNTKTLNQLHQIERKSPNHWVDVVSIHVSSPRTITSICTCNTCRRIICNNRQPTASPRSHGGPGLTITDMFGKLVKIKILYTLQINR